MLEPLQIRRACPIAEDVETLLRVEHDSLGDSDYDLAEALAVVARPEHAAYVAYAGEWGVGFCSSFDTPTGAGARLEVDMLGVLPAYRGRGIATRLIRHATQEAIERGVGVGRAVVALDNVASQKAFRRAGFRPVGAGEATPFSMLVYHILGTVPQALPDGWRVRIENHAGAKDGGVARESVALYHGGRPAGGAECLCVHTLAYRGLWIEALSAASHEARRWLARGIVERAKTLDLDQVGYLAPGDATSGNDAPPEVVAMARAGFETLGSYLVFAARFS
jgi:ribosomal protein S18 acetylase RimI-like enzyme